MATEKLDTEIRREQIVRAAVSIVANHGLQGLSIAGLARRVGLVPSAIYRHFRNKEEVIDATLDFIRSGLQDIINASCESTSNTGDRLRGILMRHVSFIRDNNAITRIVFSEEVYSGVPERRSRLYGIIREYLEGVGKIVRHGQQEGRIRSDIPPETIALMLLGLIQPAAILWHISEGAFDVTKHAEKGWKVLCEAITTEQSASIPK